MLGRSVTFGPKSVEKRPQQGNFFELTTPNERVLFDCSCKAPMIRKFGVVLKFDDIGCI